MADLDIIFDNNWNTDNVTKPTIQREEYLPVEIYERAVTTKLVRTREDYMGIIGRDHYTPESHDAWIVRLCSTTQSDAQNMIKETRRILAKYNGTSGEDRFAMWDAGDWETQLPHRWEFRYVVLLKKSGMDLGF